MIFVGSKVTAVRSEKGKKVSDIVDILLFLKRFIENNNNESVRTVENILKGKSGLYSGERDLFFNKLPYLNNLYTKISIEELYKDNLDINKKIVMKVIRTTLNAKDDYVYLPNNLKVSKEKLKLKFK